MSADFHELAERYGVPVEKLMTPTIRPRQAPLPPVEPSPDRAWILRSLRGEVATETALHYVAVARAQAKDGLLPEELADALAEGDAAYPEAASPERYQVVDIGPPPVETDPEVELRLRLRMADGVSERSAIIADALGSMPADQVRAAVRGGGDHD